MMLFGGWWPTPHSAYLLGHKWLFAAFLVDNTVLWLSCLSICMGMVFLGLKTRMRHRALFFEFAALFLAFAAARAARIDVVVTGRHYEASSVVTDVTAVVAVVVAAGFIMAIPEILCICNAVDQAMSQMEVTRLHKLQDRRQKILLMGHLQEALQKNAEGLLADARLRPLV
jgi:hypothetical protein